MLRVGYIAVVILMINVLKAQVSAPQLRCLSVGSGSNVVLTWIPPNDPGGLFFSYEIFHSSLAGGPYTTIGTVTPIGTTTYTHATAAASIQSQYYYIRTKFGPAGINTSSNSDTLHTIYLNPNNPLDGVAHLLYNNLKQPPLSSSTSSFSIYREFPVGNWVNIANTSNTFYNDSITRCMNLFYNYQIVLGDASGCVSTSNIKGDFFKDSQGPTRVALDSVSVLPNGQTVLGYEQSVSPDCVGYLIFQVINSVNTPIGNANGQSTTLFTFTSTAALNNPITFLNAPTDSCGKAGLLNFPHTTMHLRQSYDKCKYETRLIWNAYSGWDSGVSEYRVYYSVNGGNFQLLGSTNQTFYNHTGVDPAKNVTYYVRAFNGTKTVSSSSNRVSFFSYQTVAPDFIYIRSVSVINDESIKIKFFVDSLKMGSNFDLYRSKDGLSFGKIGTINFTGVGNYQYVDKDLTTRSQSYYYKAIAKDSCGNDRTSSSIVQSILLYVNNQKESEFNKKLTWNNYTGFAGGLAGYSIYRVVNDVVSNNPCGYTNGATNEYIDNIEDLAPEGSKIEYFVSAIESLGNPYGIVESANSNLATTYAEADVYVPKAFAPKGVNKIWKPVTHFVDKSDYNLKIYNRWGNLLFNTNDDMQGWDGNGAPNDTYVYLITYKNSRGEYVELQGTFTLL